MSPRARQYGLVAIVLLVFLSQGTGEAQVPRKLSVEWMYSRSTQRLSSAPEVSWLNDDRCVIYDRAIPKEQRTLEILDAKTGQRHALVDASKALASLREFLGDSVPTSLAYPAEIDKSGKHALYLFRDDIYLLDFAAASFSRLTNTPQPEQCVSFSPDGENVAFVRSNNLFVYDLQKKSERALTSDGSDSLLNGTVSWVYWEEIFGRHDTGYWWSHDSKAIAYLQTDESGVDVQHYVDVRPWTPRVITQRYPTVGDKNPVVRAGVVEIGTGQTRWIDLSRYPYEYLVRMQWLPGDEKVSIQTMNRLQTELSLFFADRKTGAAARILTETDTSWVNIIDDLHFLEGGTQFLWGSERTGYEHLFLYNLDGTLVREVTKGNWALKASTGEVYWLNGGLVGVDEHRGEIYFTSIEKSSIERHLYKIKLDGTGMSRISREDGTHSITMSPDCRYYVDEYSTASTLPEVVLHTTDGKPVWVISRPSREALDTLGLQFPTYFTVKARDGFPMPARMVKPANMEPGRKYPVIFYVYSGPSAPVVANAWARDIFWENILAQQGYIVFNCDNRSATGISKLLENTIYHRLDGEGEFNDVYDATRWLKSLPYVDTSRIGIWGWSGGGSSTLNAMTRSKEFKAGIDVAGVTDFRYYDTKYAEQYMGTEANNKSGFDGNSFITRAKDLHGKLLIVYGSYDDNVHPQNSWAFIDELIKENIRFELMVYPMRKHDIADRPARIHLFSTMLDFWLRNL